jgi:hypothetical protein
MMIGREAPGESRWRVAGNVRRTTRFAPGPALVVLLALAVPACAPPPPDLVLLNARVFTADPAQPWVEAVAIRGDRITAAGSQASIAALAGERTVQRDLGGRTVLPGLNDAHVVDPGLPARELRGFLQAALMSGVTSMQWFVGERTVAEAGAALVEAGTPVRLRVLRMPRPGPDGVTIDSRPHLPPQPTARIDIRGMGFLFGEGDSARLRQAVGWGYGTEDLLAIEPANDAVLEEYVKAVESTGVAEIWAAKQPRIERAGFAATGLAPRLKANGMVVVQRPDGELPLASLVRAGVHLALGSGRGTHPFSTLAWATTSRSDQLTMEEAVAAFTRGSARAEHWDKDKGHLSVGALADLIVASVDPFTASPEQLAGARSTLTIIGGRVVHDVP